MVQVITFMLGNFSRPWMRRCPSQLRWDTHVCNWNMHTLTSYQNPSRWCFHVDEQKPDCTHDSVEGTRNLEQTKWNCCCCTCWGWSTWFGGVGETHKWLACGSLSSALLTNVCVTTVSCVLCATCLVYILNHLRWWSGVYEMPSSALDQTSGGSLLALLSLH